ncbi:MAG: globin family protein [Chloroflexi bacterium]|nr:globin family protein [Chloroflexota bacterium]
MTPHQIHIVQASWAKIVPRANAIVDMFYEHLFELDPSVRVLFPTDMEEQRKMLLVILTSGVIGLSNLDKLTPTIQDLGKRHHGYGVLETHYETVGEALLWALKQNLGYAWNDELKEAWSAVYVVLANLMIEAAKKTA